MFFENNIFFNKKKVPSVLDHITDVGSAQFEGVDSSYRIRQQYQAANVQNPYILSAGHSPLHVAFTGTTCLAPKAIENANWLLDKLFHITQKKRLPIALNSAPRNSKDLHNNGKEDNIFWIKGSDHYADFLVYGLQVVEWVKIFYPVSSINRIISLPEIIENTSHGSQFRSAEHLPLVHVLAAMKKLEKYAHIEEISLENIIDRYPDDNNAIVAPCDEYGNGRIIVNKQFMQLLLQNEKCFIQDLSSLPIAIKNSLTLVSPGEISLWPSSNHFPNRTLGVLNIGTRWAEGTTRLTDDGVKNLSQKLSDYVGKSFSIKI